MTSSSSHTFLRLWLIGTALLLTWMCPATSVADRIVVVLSAEAAPYRETEKGLRGELAREKHAVEAVLLSSLSAKSAEELASLADAFVAIGTEAAVWLHGRLPETVVLGYCMVTDPEGAGLTKGRTAHGVRVDVPIKDQLALIVDALPQTRVIGMLYRSNNAKSKRFQDTLTAALPTGWRVEAVAIDRYETVADAITDLLGRKLDAVWTSADPSVYDAATIRSLLLAALRKHVAVFGFSAPCVRAGAFIGTSVEPQEQGKAAGVLLHKILADPTRPTVGTHESPKWSVLVNMSVAEQLGAELPKEFTKKAVPVAKPGEGARP